MTVTHQTGTETPWLNTYPANIPWDISVPVGLVHDLLDASAKRFGNRPCIDFLGKKYTYTEIANLVDRAAKGLQGLGVKHGTRVGIFMPNAVYFVVFYYAILKAGGVVVNYSPLYAVREIVSQVNDSGTDIMVTLNLDALYSKVYEAKQQSSLRKIIVCPLEETLPFPKNLLFPVFKHKEVAHLHTEDGSHVAFKDVIDNDGKPIALPLNPHDDLAVLQYTGGTTGTPKGAMLTHANVTANANQARMWFSKMEEGHERTLAALPLFHVFAMTAVMNLSIRAASEIVMMFPRFQVDEAMKMIEKHRITFFPAVPTIYTMVNMHKNVAKFDLSSLKVCLSGGAALPGEVKRQFESRTGCHLIEAYGLSETSPAATSNPLYEENKNGSIGIPLPGTTIKIVSLDDGITAVPLGEKGEIAIAGPQVMRGYWDRPDETAKCMKNGLFLTGDVGYMDSDGFTFLVDRIKDMIICGGYNVYPREVEEVIYLHNAVEEVTVVGVPDGKRGETVKAFVKIRDGKTLTEGELKEFLKDKLSPVKTPKFIEFRDALPKTIIGKLSKKELRAESRSTEGGAVT